MMMDGVMLTQAVIGLTNTGLVVLCLFVALRKAGLGGLAALAFLPVLAAVLTPIVTALFYNEGGQLVFGLTGVINLLCHVIPLAVLAFASWPVLAVREKGIFE